MDSSAVSGDLSQLTEQMEALHTQGRYRQAFDMGVQQLGPVAKWQTPELRRLATRLLSNLGLTRASQCLTYRMWRQTPNSPYLAANYVSLIARRQGPLQALQLIEQVEKWDTLDAKDRVYLNLSRVEVYTTYRDFGAAEEVLAAIPQEQRDHWVEYSVAETCRAQDDYAAAHAAIDHTLSLHPRFFSAHLFKAQLLQLDHDLAGATALLEGHWPAVENWWMGQALFGLYLEQQRFSAAESVLLTLQDLPPWQDKDIKARIKAMWADLLCAQKEYDKALPYLESRHFFHRQVAQSINRRSSGERRVLDVPFVRQRNMTCAPASMSAITTYWGSGVDQQLIIDAICYGGTQAFDERRWGEEQGWHVSEFDLTLPTLRALIDRDVPVLLGTVEPGSAHLQIIVGYDLAMGTYLLRDPYYPRLQEMLIEESHRYYASGGPRCLILLPMAERDRLAGIDLPHSALYDCLYAVNLALKQNARDKAEAALAQAEALAPGHRLTLECRRSLAFYDRDDQALLEVVEALLELYPSDINLQMRKLSCLQELGSSTVALAYLESLAAQPDCDFLILSRLADRLRRDQRESDRAERLLRHLLRRRPVHGATLYAYAGVLWDRSEYRQATQLYRFVTCLEETSDYYADSYFRATRYLKETETGLAFLTERRDRFGRRSSGPAISLFLALDSLDRSREALEVLERAVAERPEDGELMLFSARKHLYAARPKRARELLESARHLCSAVRLHEVGAEIALYELHKDEALIAYEEVLRLEPLNLAANRALMRIHAENGALPKAIAHIDRQLQRFPGNAQLLRLKYEWLEDSEREVILQTLQDYRQHHPRDPWGHRTISYVLLAADRCTDAIAAAQEAVAIDSTDCSNHAALGDALLADHQHAAAREAFRSAIRRSCDYGYAFNRLLSTTHNPDDQRADIAFIHQELLAQVSYGDGILDFATNAAQWLEADKLLEFLRFAVEVRPDLWQSWVALAVTLRDQGANAESLEPLDKAAARFPLLPRVHFERAETLRTLHREQEAMDALRQTLALSPGWVRASNRLCDLLEQRGDLDGAIELQKNAIKHSPLSSTPYGYLADLYLRTEARADALTCIQKAIALDPGYHWAWTTLYRLRREDGQAEAVLVQLQEQMQRFPNRSDLLQIYTDIEPDDAKVVAALTGYLNRRMHIDLCERLVQKLARGGDFAKAFSWVSPERWDGQPPVEIKVLEAWLQAQQQHFQRAIDHLRQVVQVHPNHYDAWRFLSLWAEKTGDRKTVKEALEQCVRLYPNDARVLCFAAEKLQAIDAAPKRIGELLQHAFELNVSDQYIALTFIDHALQHEQLDQVDYALGRMPYKEDDSFVNLRRLQLAARREQEGEALRWFVQIAKDTTHGGNVMDDAWKSLQQAGWQKAAAEALEALLEEKVDLVDRAGLALARYRLQSMKPKVFNRTLHNMEFTTGFELRYLEGYLRHLCDEKQDFPRPVEEHLRHHWGKDTFNLSLVGYLHYNRDHMHRAMLYFDDVAKREDADPWALYFASLCQRHSGSWVRGEQLMAMAATRAGRSDRYSDDIAVWTALDDLLGGKLVDVTTLAHLTRSDLAPLTEYPLSLVRALDVLQGTDCVAVFADLSPLLRSCQFAFQKFHHSPIAKHVQKRVRAHLKAHLPEQPFYTRWFWLWRLSNHF